MSPRKPKAPRCDCCKRRIRRNQHELVLSDLTTGQVIGHYHAHQDCMVGASKYFYGKGAALRASFIHPDKCGENQQHCDAGLSEGAA